ncbi:MAG: 1-acyl-sn-glycerol-3-phosphate acyltransferase [Bacteroidetes bacterium]|nr:1-acyl-sn-glycerol-3-phosphate acyltransferase [Bacteroidota bacterium]
MKHSVGMENIPKDRPVLFCSNHPNAFMDALLLGATVNRRTWSLARSDAFSNKMIAKFLGFIGIIPIYRLLEGAENLSKNDEMIDRCTQVLSENKPIMIYSEGLCIQERRLRSLKKGTARIALTAEERNDFKLNLTIIPVGLNYSATPWKFRSRFHVRFGEPFAAKDYEEIYKTNKARAMNLFTRDLEKRMAQQLIIIDDKANDELVYQLEQMFVKKWSKEEYRNPNNQTETFRISKEITHLLKECEKVESSRVTALREKVAIYFSKIKALHTRDWIVEKNNLGELKSGGIVFNYFIFLLFSPIWLFGLITNYVPYKVPYVIAKKVAKNIEWQASVNATIAAFLWQFYWLAQSLVVALVFRNWYLLGAFMLLVPITGMLAQELYVLVKKANGARKFLLMKNSSEVGEVQKMRNEIVEEVELLKAKFPLGAD